MAKKKEMAQECSKKKISQKIPQVKQLYQLEEFGNSFAKVTDIMEKIKDELKIQSFTELVKFLEKLYLNIVAQEEDVGRKTLTMDGLSKFPTKGSDRENV